MAEEKAPIVVAPNELVALYDQAYEREWNKEKGAFKNPVLIVRMLLHYGRATAGRLLDAFNSIKALEARVAELEAFKKEAEEMATAMMSQMAAAESPAPQIEPAPVAALPPAATEAPAPSANGTNGHTDAVPAATAPAVVPAVVPASVAEQQPSKKNANIRNLKKEEQK